MAEVRAQAGESASPATVAAVRAVPVPHPPVSRISARARQIAACGVLSVEQAQAGLDKGWLR